MKKSRKFLIVCLILGLIVILFTGCSGSEKASDKTTSKEVESEENDDWPKEKITVIIPYAAGGTADTLARGLIPYWEKELGVPMVIENRQGASTQVGATLFSKLPPDGNSIIISAQNYLSVNEIINNADYKVSDFAMINIQQYDPVSVTVLEDSTYKTFDDLVKAIKENPGELKWGTLYGGPLHIAGEILKDELGLDFKTVFYDGGNDMRTALLGRHVDFIIGQANGDLALKGKARVLAINSKKRMPIWPDSPTFLEVLEKYNVEMPNLGVSRFIAVHAKLKETYPERFQKLVETYQKAFNNSEYQGYLEKSGEITVTEFNTPEESEKINQEIHDTVLKYKDKIGKK
ncbi:MAG: tripartite tricarboxylate transporter substrate binding protein [Peptococcaceae bacterium]